MAARVGHWRTVAAQDTYATAYRDVLAELPEPTRTLDVETEFGSIRVLEWVGTEPGPPAVLVPGHSSGAPMWAENLASWIGQRTVYAFDPLGDAGFSVQRLPLTRFEDQAEWISQAVTALGVERVHVVGHSFGGANAAIFAARHPDQVASVTLLEPILVIRPLPAAVYVWSTVLVLPVPRWLRDKALAQIGGVSVAEVQERTPMSVMIEAASTGYSAALPQPRRITDDEWRSLRAPLRVDIGGRQSLSGGQGAVDRMRDLVPAASVTLWPDATHSLPMQERAILDPALLEFWRENS